MNKTAEKDSSMKKTIHYGTIIAIFILIIPASISSFYIPLILVLFGVNIFNSIYSHCRGNTKLVLLAALVTAVPLMTYLFLVYF